MNKEIIKLRKRLLCLFRDANNFEKCFDGMLEKALDQALTSQKAKFKEVVEGMEKYHKEFECNGANNGKGCYETFCEDQNCRNAPKDYNQALQDVLKGIDNI